MVCYESILVQSFKHDFDLPNYVLNYQQNFVPKVANSKLLN